MGDLRHDLVITGGERLIQLTVNVPSGGRRRDQRTRLPRSRVSLEDFGRVGCVR